MRNVVLFTLLLGLLHGVRPWKEIKKECKPGCTKRGNCNHEFGTCECPYGWGGDACELPVAGACRTKADAELVLYGVAWPKSCECFKQLAALTCATDTDQALPLSMPNLTRLNQTGQQWYCNNFAVRHWGAIKCFERVGLPPEQQFTEFPTDEEVAAGKIKWYRGKDYFALREIEKPDQDWLFHGQHTYIALDKCPNRCSERGACYLEKHSNKQVCSCYKGYTGPTCSEVTWELSCLNKCSGRGECVAGFCKCAEGYWGLDCSRSKAYAPDPADPREVEDRAYNRTHLRIYRWELPWHIAFPAVGDEHNYGWDRLYAAFEVFYNLLAKDWVTRTENPWEANMFYIPQFMYYYTGNVGARVEGPFVERSSSYIKEHYPVFYNRSKLKDHFLWLPGDNGGCWLHGPLQRNPIKLLHWGYKLYGSGLEPKDVLWQIHCFKPERDVVVPPNLDINMGHAHRQLYDRAEETFSIALDTNHALHKRPWLLFFGCSVRPHISHYSGGARTKFAEMAKRDQPKDLKFEGDSTAEGYNAVFCFIPWGNGWGNRMMYAMRQACIPVVVQDLVYQPFDEVMPYDEFSVRIRHSDIDDLMHILRAIPQEEVLRLRRNMYKYYQAWSWYPETNGTAYNWTLAALHRKLFNLWGHHYRRRGRSSQRRLRALP